MLTPLALAFVPVLVPGDRPFPTAVVVPDATGGEFRGRGDFDGDGDVDLIWYSGNVVDWTGVAIYFNDGAGNFTPGPYTPFAHAEDFQVQTLQPRPGDFDGDGNLDFAINLDAPWYTAGEGIEFFLGDGAGSFPTRVVHHMNSPFWMDVGDVDGDAADEVFVFNGDSNFDRWLSWIDFQGGAPVALPALQLGTANVPNHLIYASLDVDGDGIDDVAATGSDVNAHDVLTFFPTVNGTPTLGQQFALPPEMQNINHRIAAGDLDGDGDEDLVMAKFDVSVDDGPRVQAFERTAAGWNQRPVVAVPGVSGTIGVHHLTLVDWNGDGWLELASDAGVGGVMRSNGDWTWSPGLEIPSTGQRNGAGAFDADGDGNPDLAGGVTIQFGDGGFEQPAGETASTLSFPDGIHFLDLEGDGDLDLLGAGGGHYAVNDAAGSFTSSANPFFQLFPELVSPLAWDAPMAFADFDGDGVREYLAMFYQSNGIFPFGGITPIGIARIPEDGKGGYLDAIGATAWGDIIASPLISAPQPLWSTGDVDGDGDVDLLVDGGYRENDGSGRLDVAVTAWTGRGRAVADLDGDGFNDVLVTRPLGANTQLHVHYGSAGGFTPVFVGNAPNEADAVLRDFDGDGDLDLAAADREEPGLRLFENVGGTFAGTPTVLPNAVVDQLRNLGVVDVNGDGVLDLYVKELAAGGASGSFSTLSVYHGSTSGFGFERVIQQLATFGLDGFADVDSDGDLDAVGRERMLGTLVEGEGGALHQAGDGVAGTGDFVPVLGATGPVLTSTFTDELRLVNGLGGANVILVFGTQSTVLVDQPLPGLEQYVADPIALPVLQLAGAPGVAGAGHLELPLPNLVGLFGLRFVHQAFVADPAAPSGWSASNGLAITYGE